MDVRVRPWRKLSTEELMLLDCDVGENSWESLGLQGFKPVNPKGNQSCIFIGRTDAEVETPILLPSDVKNWLITKNSDAGKDWRQEEKAMTEDAMIGWHHQLDGHEFGQAQGVGDRWGIWCAIVHGIAESDMTVWLNWTEDSFCYTHWFLILRIWMIVSSVRRVFSGVYKISWPHLWSSQCWWEELMEPELPDLLKPEH